MKQLKNHSPYSAISKLILFLLATIVNCTAISAQEDPYLKFDLVNPFTKWPAIFSIAAFEDKVWVASSEGLWQINSPKDSIGIYANKYTIDTIVLVKIDNSAADLGKVERQKKLIYSIAVKDTNEIWASDIDGRLYCIRNKNIVFDAILVFDSIVLNRPLRNISWANAEKTKLHLIYPSTYGEGKNDNEHNIYTIDINTKIVEKDPNLNKNHSRKQATKVFLEGLATDNKDEVCLATNIGLVAYNAKKKELTKLSNDNSYKIIFNKDEIYTLSIIDNKTHFIAYNLVSRKKLRSFVLPDVNNKERMRVMYLDNLGYIWLASNSANIIYFKAKEENPAQNYYYLSNAAKMAGVTTNNNTLSIIDIVQTKVEAQDSSIWIATGAGLFRYGILKIASKDKNEKKDTIVAEKYTVTNLSFGISDTIINRDAYDELNMMVKRINRDTSLTIRINGHTDMPIFADKATPADSIKALADMQLLSEARARAVFTYLQSKGVDAKKMEVHGYGASRPLNAPSDPANKTPQGTHSPNRRVEIEFIKTTN